LLQPRTLCRPARVFAERVVSAQPARNIGGSLGAALEALGMICKETGAAFLCHLLGRPVPFKSGGIISL
jgi:hypothetical protein